MHAPALLACVLASALGPGAAQPADTPDETAFLALLEEAREQVAEQDWEAARARIERALEEHAGRPYVLVHRARVVAWLTQCRFWSEHERPRPKDVVSGELLRYEPRGGSLRIRYRPDQLGDFLCFPSEDEDKGAQPELEPELAFLHPAMFEGGSSLEIRGVRGGGILSGKLPTLIVGADWRECVMVSYGLAETRVGTRVYSAEPKIVHFRDGRSDVLDRGRSCETVYDGSTRLSVQVRSSTIAAREGGTQVLSARKPRGLGGRLGFTGIRDFEELEIEGKAERSWIEGRIDERVADAWVAFTGAADLDERIGLPEWLRLGGADWRFPFAGRGCPGGEDPERAETLAQAAERCAQGKRLRNLRVARELSAEDPADPLPAWLRVMAAYARQAWGEALEECRGLGEREPDFAAARELEVELLVRLGRRMEAVEASGGLDAPSARATAWSALGALKAGELQRCEELVRAAAVAGSYGPELAQVAGSLRKARNGPEWVDPAEYESEHFIVASDMGRAVCQEAAGHLETGYDRYAALFPRDGGAPRRKFRVYLFSGRSSYLLYVADVAFADGESTLGMYSTTLDQLLIWNHADRDSMFRTVRHEGLHQYLDALFDDGPRWLHEGLAEYFEAADFTRSGAQQYPPAPEHVAYLNEDRERWTALATFLHQDPGDFMESPQTHYAQAWALVHYLRHGPRELRGVLADLVERLSAGTPSRAAVELAFAGLDLGELERGLRKYVAGLD